MQGSIKHAEIITIGDELLIGQVIDTNSAWIGQQLNAIGVNVKQISSVSDSSEHILKALEEARTRVDIVLITGGLGPTKDDITKKTLCTYFHSGLRIDHESLSIIESIFKARGREVSELNRQQALVPENCEVLLNKLGTAPGMWFEDKGCIFISMPGVPYEMKGIMQTQVLPRLQKLLGLPPILHKTILTQGIGESYLSELIADWEDQLPDHMKLAYLPSPGMVRLRITAQGPDEIVLRKEMDLEVAKVLSIAGDYIYGFDNDTLESLIGSLLRTQRKTLSTAESCTGGYIAHRITSVPGSSDYYMGSLVAYANWVKENFLSIAPELIEKHGAVSEEVVAEMAVKSRQLFKTDYSIACSGIAGPTGGTDDKPIGTVWIAISCPGKVLTRKLKLGKVRERVIMETSQHALNLLRKVLLGEKSD